MAEKDLRLAISALPALQRLAFVQAYEERAWRAEGPEKEFWFQLATLMADVHNDLGEPKRRVLEEARRVVDEFELDDVGIRFLDTEGNPIDPFR